MKRGAAAVLVQVAFFALAGCKSKAVIVRSDYYVNHGENAALRIIPLMPKADKTYCQRQMALATLSMDMGNESEARDCLAHACEMVDNIDLTGVKFGFVFSAKNKAFLGDPYERSSAHAYRGLLLYQDAMKTQDEQSIRNVIASFEKVRQHDSFTDEEPYKDDWALAHFMLAKAYMHLKDQGNMRAGLEMAKKICPGNPYLDEGVVAGANFTLLVGVGMGPYKVQGGLSDQIAVVSELYEGEEAQVWIDGKEAGKAVLIEDLNRQAVHRSDQTAKALAGLGRALMKKFFGFGDTSADLRAWDILPARIYVFTGKVEPGLHTVAIRFPKEPRYNQVHYYLPVDGARPDNLYYFTSIRNKHSLPPKPKEKEEKSADPPPQPAPRKPGGR